jgi:FAD/FMN-containing dehydrogenase
VAVNYGANFSRLQEVKRRYDPDNLFHLNQNIEP